MNIAVIGTGYVGIVTAAVFADFGNQVWGVDVDPQRVKDLKAGRTPIHEPRLDEFLHRGNMAGRLHFTGSYDEALKEVEIVFVCVGTPQKENGEVELTYVESAIDSIAKSMKKPLVIVLKSTVPPGIHKQLAKRIETSTGIEYYFASVPEFLREGCAIEDTLNPSRVVIGAESKQALDLLLELHNPLPGERVVTDIMSAQMIKYAANAFLATKISFANSIARICDCVGADVAAVMQGIGLDPRIGRSFLYPGLGFGGSCFPKDIKGLYHLAEANGYDFRLLKEVDYINASQVGYVLKKAEKLIGSFDGKKVALLGLAFKPDTDDMRDARSTVLAEELIGKGASITAYDPIAMEVAKRIIGDKIAYVGNALAAVKGADAVVIATEWNEFKEVDLNDIKKLMKGDLLIDGRNIYDPKEVKKLGFKYVGVGRG